jgi:predicted flap endonuclease-1-like 5' DNA nuclease
MSTIFEANTVPIVVALLIGLVIGWWMFKRARISRHDEQTHRVEEVRPMRVDTPEGNGIADQGAAAASDVAGEVLGVQVHSQLPGAEGPPDNLELMKGVGPKFVTRLNENGIIRFDQIARLSDNEVSILDDKLGPFKGRLRRDRVVEQANYLARGDTDGFEAQFGKLGSAS